MLAVACTAPDRMARPVTELASGSIAATTPMHTAERARKNINVRFLPRGSVTVKVAEANCSWSKD